MVEFRRVRCLLDSVDGLPVEPRVFGELLLAQLPFTADGANAVSDLASAGWYPGGQRIGWHAYTLVGAVTGVCTIVGTFQRADFSPATTPSVGKHTFE